MRVNELRALLAPGQCLPPAVAGLAQTCTSAVPAHRPDMAAVAGALQTLVLATR